MTYNVAASNVTVGDTKATLLKVGFGDPADNATLVVDADAALKSLNLQGGELVLINGPASLPVALVLGHAISHLFGAVACFDPKMAGYVVAVSHGDRQLGSFIPTGDVS